MVGWCSMGTFNDPCHLFDDRQGMREGKLRKAFKSLPMGRLAAVSVGRGKIELFEATKNDMLIIHNKIW